LIICVCAGVTSDDIKESIDKGNKAFMELVDDLRVCTGCGDCRDDILRLIVKGENHE